LEGRENMLSYILQEGNMEGPWKNKIKSVSIPGFRTKIRSRGPPEYEQKC